MKSEWSFAMTWVAVSFCRPGGPQFMHLQFEHDCRSTTGIRKDPSILWLTAERQGPLTTNLPLLNDGSCTFCIAISRSQAI